jgi:antirestriction protein ArdC
MRLPKIIISDYFPNKFEVKGFYNVDTNTINIFEQSCFDDRLNYKWCLVHEYVHFVINAF